MKALVVLSGGQDSITCLAWAIEKYETVGAITFSYNQRHQSELIAAKEIVDKYDVKDHLVIASDHFAAFDNSALLSGSEKTVEQPHENNSNLPASFVPNRNAYFLTLAHAYAQKKGYHALITGVCQTDYSGYPDCRSEFITAIETALNIGSESSIDIVTPLMWLNKAKTWRLADELGAMDDIIAIARTCYNNSDTENVWGKGCGGCPACQLRKKGYYEYLTSK